MIYKAFERNSGFAPEEKSSSSIFHEFLASIEKVFILAGRLCTSLEVEQVLRFTWYFLIS